MELQTILRGIRKADGDFNMIPPGSRVAVALSGGKDSLLLAMALKQYQNFSHTDFELAAIHVEMGFEKSLVPFLQEFCDSIDIPLEVVETDLYSSTLNTPQHLHHGKIQCSLCSRMKKGNLFRAASERGFDAVAFGHHLDDAMETLLMNLFYSGRNETLSPSFYLSRQDIREIRPMIYLREEEIVRAARKNDITAAAKVCPADGYTNRQTVKEEIRKLKENNPLQEKNLARAVLAMIQAESKNR